MPPRHDASFFFRNDNWNFNRKDGPLVGIVFHLNAAAHFTDDAVADPETEASPFAGFFGGIERVENFSHFFFTESRTVVPDIHHDNIIAAATVHLDRAVAADGVDRIGEKV